jgi:TonB family protein
MPSSRALSAALALAFVFGLLAPATTDTLRDVPGWNEASDYDQPPRAIKIVKPKYPKDALAKGIEGVVEVEILIDAGGKVTRARVLKSVPGLDEAALDTVERWRFSPAMKNGHPVATTARAPVMFRLDRGPGPASRR